MISQQVMIALKPFEKKAISASGSKSGRYDELSLTFLVHVCFKTFVYYLLRFKQAKDIKVYSWLFQRLIILCQDSNQIVGIKGFRRKCRLLQGVENLNWKKH